MLGDPGEALVHARAAVVDRAVVVAQDHVGGAGVEQQPQHRGAGRARAGHDDLHAGQVLAHHAQRVGERGEHHDRGAVLVVVEHRDVEHGAQPALDLEAARGGDVLQVDAAEPGGDRGDGPDDLVRVLGVQADGPGVDVREALEQRRLALHHRQRRVRAEVAEAEHRGAVGHHGDAVALDRQPAGVLRLGRECQRHPRHAGRVGHRQVVAVAQRHLGPHLDLAAQVQQEGPVADLVHRHAGDPGHRGDQRLGVRGVDRGAGDVHPEPAALAGVNVERGDHPAGLLTARVISLTARPCEATSSRAVMEYETLGAMVMSVSAFQGRHCSREPGPRTPTVTRSAPHRVIFLHGAGNNVSPSAAGVSMIDAEDGVIDVTRLRVAIARLSRRLRRHELAGLTPTQLAALSTVERSGPLRLGDLAAAEGIAPSTLTRLVAVLEELGYVHRYADPKDARATTLTITPKGTRRSSGCARRAPPCSRSP